MSLAFLYAGQGSQHPGMGADLYEAHPAFRAVLDAAGVDFDLKTTMFTDPDGVLNLTEYTQPCMVAFAAGMTALLAERGIVPDYAAGLSLGEYSALQCAGVFTAPQAISLAAFRGKAMAAAAAGRPPGITAVLGLDREKLQERLAKMAGGVAIIRVGAATEVEMKEKKLRIEDALNATRAAVEEGIVAGGGTAYVNAIASVEKLLAETEGDEKTGVSIIAKALTEPIDDIRMTSNKTVYAGWERTGVPDRLNGDEHFAYIIGRDDGLVHPEAPITRAEVATIFFRLLTDEARDEYLTGTSPFADVASDAWYATAVATMQAMGIVEGRSPSAFHPEAPITRGEFAAIAARFDSAPYHGDDRFSDISGHWAAGYINQAAVKGWVEGQPDGSFAPDRSITRAEAMTTINRVLGRLPETADDLLDDMIAWPDNPPDAWYYLAVQEATNSHDYERKADTVHETWTGLQPVEDWTRYEQ